MSTPPVTVVTSSPSPTATITTTAVVTANHTAAASAAAANADDGAPGDFGDMVPYSDPYWYAADAPSPFYKETHRRFRAVVRRFVDTELVPNVDAWDEAGTYPADLHKRAYKAGVYAAVWPAEYGGTPPEEFDMFHDLILVDELARCGAGGVLWACFFSFGIALPPVLSVGSQYLKDRVARRVITGDAIMSLAISEPGAGSDVANIQTTAHKSACGTYYTLNGAKKWITSGTKAEFFTVAARTGGPGRHGLSLFLVERGWPGFSVRRMQTQGWWISGTAYLEFDDVRVPASHLIGVENQGFVPMMANFVHERFVLAATSNRYARCCLEDAITYARTRRTFGRRLIEHQVIRHKIAEMARQVEATHALAEQLAYRMQQGRDATTAAAGIVALFKVQATKTFEFCAREASQILGGASYLRSGKGQRIERLYREVRVNAIGGGSEEILLNLACSRAKL